MNNNKNESTSERIERLKREKEAAKAATPERTELVSQLTHQSDGEPDFEELARKLEERKALEAKGENFGHVKMTIYVDENIAAAFNALCTKRGDQKKYTNQALSEFVSKKAKELGL